jgi:crotonobetainyl-CoA:carnitine CoA-transferase CaiB-like acyl-CoA transferase
VPSSRATTGGPVSLAPEATGESYFEWAARLFDSADRRAKPEAAGRFTSGDGRALFRQLTSRADVVIEGFPPGRMDRWGIGYRQLVPLDPRLAYAVLSTHGQFGPRAEDSGPEYDHRG